jgi:hypothetical protein
MLNELHGERLTTSQADLLHAIPAKSARIDTTAVPLAAAPVPRWGFLVDIEKGRQSDGPMFQKNAVAKLTGPNGFQITYFFVSQITHLDQPNNRPLQCRKRHHEQTSSIHQGHHLPQTECQWSY